MVKTRYDQNGAVVELDKYPKKNAEMLLRFNLTVQRIADRCNESRQLLPTDDDLSYKTWHNALDGKPVWDEIVNELDSLYKLQATDPRAYLPGPPDADALFGWMKQIAGAKWWVQVLGLDMKVNTLTAWMTRGTAQQNIDDLRERVREWWGRVDAACTQADMARAYHAMELAERGGGQRPYSFASYFYTYVREDGHSVEQAREHYVKMADLAVNHHLRLIDLADPKPPCVPSSIKPVPAQELRDEFEEKWSRGLMSAMPRDPGDVDLSDTVSERQWPDRRDEEGPWDENQELWNKWYRKRTSWRWDTVMREKVEDGSHIVQVSDDGQTWRAPTEREAQGWYHPSIEIAKWRQDHGVSSVVNQYWAAVEEAKRLVHDLRQDRGVAQKHRDGMRSDAELDALLRAAEREYARARADY